PDGQFFLPLHAHTPGQRPVGPADALASLLMTAGVPAPQIPPGLEAREARWRDHVADRKILLLLDDAAGHEQVRPLLPGTDYPGAAASLAQAVATAGDLGDLPGQAYALNQLGFLQVLTGDYPAAAASHQQALAVARSVPDRPAAAVALICLGLVQQLTGDYPASTASHQQALTQFRDLGDLGGQAYGFNGLGVVQQETGDYAAAAASHQQALTLFRDLGEMFGQAQALNDLGLVQR
ncbi:MAG TPA: tetratricopeptide repeat protein, partial [Streptosporangiaceae bacterium]|nr:tetratricopeptide repeat protein [Streptosporangiaceae bacterium]